MRWFPCFLAVLTVCLLPSVAAHGDAPGFTWSGTLLPGEDVVFVRALHWHRIVGAIDAGEAASAVSLTYESDEGEQALAIDPEGRVNALIRCCLGVGWADITIRLTNTGTEPIHADLDLALIHDDFAVLADGAEGGTGSAILLLSGMTAAAAWWSRPRSPASLVAGRKWTRVSGIAIALGWCMMIGSALLGMFLYGGGPLLGSLAVFAIAPLVSSFVNAHLVGTVIAFIFWTTALFAWSAARRNGGLAGRSEHLLAAAILIGGPLFTLLFALEYRLVPVVAGYGLVPIIVFVIVRWYARPKAALTEATAGHND